MYCAFKKIMWTSTFVTTKWAKVGCYLHLLNNATIRGVGLLLSLKSYRALNTVESINQHTLIAAIFNGNPSTNITSSYNSTNVSNEGNVSDLYHNLTGIPKYNVIVIRGDMNIKIGDLESNGLSFHQETNHNG